ncbi:hypothetical protein GGP41_003067 [Bipolaris sorokiniana]|uniref:Uncharacterized protein n=1 Tax=Cochliobolus sativus TaxID=45130 RepID=A0A8H5ZCI7_COCSA|nr:hypothetical protein GGP41_003067 [Bipolaris sorokiniana]
MLARLVPFQQRTLVNMHFSALQLSWQVPPLTRVLASLDTIDLQCRVQRGQLLYCSSETPKLLINQFFCHVRVSRFLGYGASTVPRDPESRRVRDETPD